MHFYSPKQANFPIPRPPHSNVRGQFTEIETIYRAYQVLLLNRRGKQE
jgi:hypothetical protein